MDLFLLDVIQMPLVHPRKHLLKVLLRLVIVQRLMVFQVPLLALMLRHPVISLQHMVMMLEQMEIVQ